MLTMREIAKKSGVSVATVSRHINNKGYVGEETKNKIQQIIDKYNYAPNQVAQSLSNRSSKSIAVISPDMTNPFFPELVGTIERNAREKGYSLTLFQQENLNDEDFWKEFRNNYIDGFILVSSDMSMNNLKYLKTLNIPFIKIDRAVPADENMSVSVDNFRGAKLAVNHLIEIGCKKIAHISGPKSIYTATERLMGYYEAIIDNQMESIVFEGDFTHKSGKEQTLKLLDTIPDVDGIFYSNDLMAIGAIRVFNEKGIHLPRDIAIIGFDDIYINEMVAPTLSSIKQPIVEMATVATEKLINLINNDSNGPKEDLLLNVSLVERESTLGFKNRDNVRR